MKDQSPDAERPHTAQLSNFLTFRVSKLHGKLNAQASRILQASVGITLNQWRIIAFIGDAGQITASKLIRETALDKGLVSRNVSMLIRDGLVTSAPDKTDTRVRILQLTEAGQAIYDTALPRMRQRQVDLRSTVSAGELETFLRVIAALEAAVDKSSTDSPQPGPDSRAAGKD